MEVSRDSIPFIFIGIVILAGNIYVCILYRQHNILHTAANRFVISFAVCDMMIAILFIPLYIFNSNLSSYVAGLSSFGSILNLLALTYERYIAIFHALRYHEILNPKKIRGLMIAVWLSTFIITLLPLPWELTLSSDAYLKWSKIYSGILTAIITVIISTTTYIYLRIFTVNRYHMKKERELRRLAVVESRDKGERKKIYRFIELFGRQRSQTGQQGTGKKNNTSCKPVFTDLCCPGCEVIYQETSFQDKGTNMKDRDSVGCGREGKKHCKITLNKESRIANDNGRNRNAKKSEPSEDNEESDGQLVESTDSSLGPLQRLDGESNRICLHAVAKPKHNGTRSCQKMRVKNILREIKAARVIAIIFTINCLCWLPIIIINFCDVVSPKGLATYLPKSFITASLYLFVLNSMINPFTYALFKKDFRKVISRRLRMLRQKFD